VALSSHLVSPNSENQYHIKYEKVHSPLLKHVEVFKSLIIFRPPKEIHLGGKQTEQSGPHHRC